MSRLKWFTVLFDNSNKSASCICYMNDFTFIIMERSLYRHNDKSISIQILEKSKLIYEDVFDGSLEETKEIVEEWYSIYKQLEEN
jgi:hypothetical protein